MDSINSAEWRAHTKLQRFAQRLRQAIREASGRLDSTAPLQLSEMEALAARLQTQASRLVRIADLLRQYREIQASLGEERLKPHGDLAKEHAALDERMKGLAQQSLEGAGVREADDFIASLEGILRDLNGLATRLAQRPQAVPPPVAAAAPESRPAIEPPAPALSPAPRVREGFSAFFRGDLEAAGAAVKGVDHPYAHLLRGAVVWTLFASRGGTDAGLKRQAEESFAAARRAGLKPEDLPGGLFSPKLVAFFQGTR